MDALAAPPLAVSDLTVSFGSKLILDRVSFTAGPGCWMVILGPNGAGKSTLFNALAGLLPLKAGEVRIHGQSLDAVRGRLGYVPQNEKINWRVPINVQDVVLQGCIQEHRWFRRPGRAVLATVEESLHQVRMWKHRHALVKDLSVGQRQRVFLARALGQGADVLLCDETLSGVDRTSRDALLSVFKQLRAQGRTILMASHLVDLVGPYSDECLCLNGCVYACGKTNEVLTQAVLHKLYGTWDQLET